MAPLPAKADGGVRLPGADTPGRPYATPVAEVNRPYIAGEGPAGQREAAETWRWIVLALIGVGALLAYTRGWPALEAAVSRPGPARDLLLPRSADPLYVVAGVGVGWFWLLFIATPAALAVFAPLAWAALGWFNYQVRAGYHGHVKPGQTWTGERYPAAAIISAVAAAGFTAAGMLLRWAGPAIGTLVGQLLAVGILAVLTWGEVALGRWALARAGITRRINVVTYLTHPILGWSDFRGGRVKIGRCAYPHGQNAYPRTVKLVYAQSHRLVDQSYLDEVASILAAQLGQHYRVEHDALRCTLVATQCPAAEEATIDSAEAVLAPLVASWFDPAAAIINIRMRELTPEEGTRKQQLTDGDDNDAEARSAYTDNDVIGDRIAEFTIRFAYNLKVSSPYRRGAIEGSVADALGGSWEAEWSMTSSRVRFVRCPGLPTMVPPPLDFPKVTRATIRQIYASTQLPFAIDAYGNEICWDFKQSPHMLVAGATSTGKTSLLMTVATQAAARGFNVVWVDPKGFDSPGMQGWPNVSLVTAGTDEDGLVGHTAALRFLADTMRERLSQVKVNPNRANDFDPIIVITDEFSNLVVALAEFYSQYRTTKEKGQPPTTIDVGILLRTARAVGIHMVLGIQRPDVMFIAGEARDNTALRVAMGRLRSKDAAIMMFNDPVAGTRLMPGIKGRGTVQLPDGTFREVQAFYTPLPPATPEQRAKLTDREREILDALSAVDSFWPRRVVDSALRDYDPADDEQKADMSFSKIRDSEIVLAADRPDLDPTSDCYVMPNSKLKRPTMDDDHYDHSEVADSDDAAAGGGEDNAPVTSVRFGAPVDGFADDYLPGVDDEYGPAVAVGASDLRHGDLVDVSVDDVTGWRYVAAEPYVSEDEHGQDRLVIPYRDLASGLCGDIEVDPYEVFESRRLHLD